MVLVTDEEKPKCFLLQQKGRREKPNYWTLKPLTQENPFEFKP
jgi:hypothetical protein